MSVSISSWLKETRSSAGLHQHHKLPALCRAQPSQELERTNALVLYYLHAWLNPCIFDAAFLELPRVSALLVRRLRGGTSLPEAMASGLRSVIAGFS